MIPKKHNSFGITSLITGIIGIVIVWIPFVNFAAIPLGIIAVITGGLGFWAKSRKDSFGLAGFILGVIIIVLGAIVVIAFGVYFYVGQMVPSTYAETSPSIAWSLDSSDNELIITMCSPSDSTYADSPYDPNLVFSTYGVEYHVSNGYDFSLSSYSYDAYTGYINAGDTITGLENGRTYTIIWKPTNEVIGMFTT